MGQKKVSVGKRHKHKKNGNLEIPRKKNKEHLYNVPNKSDGYQADKSGGIQSLSAVGGEPHKECLECERLKKAKKCAKNPKAPVSKPVEVAKKPAPTPIPAPLPPPIEVVKSIPPPDTKPLKFKDYPREVARKAAQEDDIRARINSRVGPDIEHHLVGPTVDPTPQLSVEKNKEPDNNAQEANTKAAQVARSEG